MKVVSVILLLDSSFALLALPVSSAARGIVAVRAPRLSRCTLVQSLLSMFSRGATICTV